MTVETATLNRDTSRMNKEPTQTGALRMRTESDFGPDDTVSGSIATAEIHVRTEQFSIFYGQHEAVKKVTMDIGARAVTAIIGPSGCGKSTLLRAINRMNDLIPHCTTAGKMIFDGEDIYQPRIDVVALRRRVGMVFQKPNPFPKSIFDNVAYGPRLHANL